MPLKIGPLDKKLRFLTEAAQQESTYGTVSGGWVPHAEVWANKEDALPSRDESLLAGTLEVRSVKVRYRFRWRDDITSLMRVEELGGLKRTLNIIGGPVEIGDRKSFMEILCEEVKRDE